ncbi:probable isopenicillin N synthase and related dioxygenases [Cephalotrichum gorgonifer]|uniref:Probable isopenicillin N synthase and related dioxygenases n=1 Tax=Cephalotrichum gorgonifer TaxID=2041049 RepID=A0AAE8SZ62_9PEZI|nr:probable isopenicillin N synthase and related dioxygenases [Cephalotrichum gorgonifer]
MPIPRIDFSASAGDSTAAKAELIQQVREACKTHGFFQLTGHGIPQSLLDEVVEQSKTFFALPLETKEKYDKVGNEFNRGYERLRAQNFEKKTEGDLKEGYYFGLDLPMDHPQVVAKKFNMGPNVYPDDIADAAKFRRVIDEYFSAMRELAEKIVRLICATLDVDDAWVSEFVDTPIAILRLLHYPPQPSDASEFERGIGAHTDFGAITILLQDLVGGLQVWDRAESQWADVTPTRGAFVVNLGNLMMRWTDDEYLSNLHRVINKSGEERYSVPFFFSGNPDFIVKSFSDSEKAKYSPISVGEWISARYADTYGTSKEKAVGELLPEASSA